MPRSDVNPKQASPLKRILGSAWLRMLIFVLLFLVLTNATIGGATNNVQDRETEFLADAVRRAAVQSYALEGRFPDSLNYLEENYALSIDHNRFAVYYEPMGDNLLPTIRIIPLVN